MKVLFTGGAPKWVHEELEAEGHTGVDVPADEYVDQEKFAKEINNFNVYVSGGIEDCTRPVIEAADNLKAIMFLGVDYKAYIDADAAIEKNIPIINTPGANARAVAETAFFLMLMAARKVPTMLKDMNDKTWQNQKGFELQNKTVGIIGSGPIAKQLSSMACGIGMNVIYYSRSGVKEGMMGEYNSFDDVLKKADIVSLNVPKDAGEIFGKDEFLKMKNHAVLINTAPALLVDGDALYDALSKGEIASAAFDCFYAEGEKAWSCPESKLLELGHNKFFLTPHSGYCTNEASDNMFRIVVDAVKSL